MKLIREYKHFARFESKARCVVDTSRGKHLAVASLADLKSILPHDSDRYPDLLPIAGNACVVNLGNGNGDMMDTDVGLMVFPQFVHKFINLEHDRNEIVGHLTNAVPTKFHPSYALGSGSELADIEALRTSNEPFNIAVGGYIYMAAKPDVAMKIIEANDPESPQFLSVAFSWELAFDEYKLLLGSRERDGECEIISDPQKVEAWSSYLKCNKGTGLSPDGRPLYRLISWAKKNDGQIDEASVLALGVALTLAPAGAVAGIVTPLLPDTEHSEASIEENSHSVKNSSEIISQSATAHVTSNTNMKVLKNLDDIKALNDESAKEFSFANIENVLQAGIQAQLNQAITQHSKEYTEKLESEKQASVAAQQKTEKLEAELTQVKTQLSEAQNGLETLRKAQAEASAAQTFQNRMAHFHEKFELSDEDSKAIASRIQGLDDASFEKVATSELAIFLAPKSKESIAAAKNQAQASQQAPVVEDPKNVVTQAVANANVTQASLPNGVQPAATSLKDKYAKAFSLGEGIKFQPKNK